MSLRPDQGPTPTPQAPAETPAPDEEAARGPGASPASGESRYRRRPPGAVAGRDPEANRVLRLVLTDPDTVPMTEQQHEQAIDALSAMIVSWLQAQAHHSPPGSG